ncbi:hypothetical protein ES705_40349 [subsurface metagenome]
MKILQNAMIAGFITGLLACSGTNDTSDAYGNFEAVEIIISAETAGVIQGFKLEEGQTIHEGQILGWIDTIQMDLRRKQIVARRNAVLTRFDNIKAEIAVQEQQKKNLLVDPDDLSFQSKIFFIVFVNQYGYFLPILICWIHGSELSEPNSTMFTRNWK